MKGFAVVALCVIFAAIVSARPEEKYTDQFDNVDVDEILHNQRLYDNYFGCLHKNEKCTPDAKKLREILPDALQSGCSKCTDIQKTQSKKVIDFLVKEKPEDFKTLEKQYDPDRAYRTKFADKLKAEGIVLPD